MNVGIYATVFFLTLWLITSIIDFIEFLYMRGFF